jgi:hypothetical protein
VSIDTLMLDVYCERAGAAGLWAEPVNALTNLAFIVAAVVVGLRLARAPGLGWRNGGDLWLLALLLAVIGVGSGLYHTFATPWALLADVLPITLFINVYLLAFGWRVLGLRWVDLPLLWLGYQAVSFGLVAGVGADALNGSVGYLPALAFLVAFAWWLHRSRHPMWRTMVLAAALFAVSVTLRTLDPVVCGWLPVGTHFLWHLLNALLLFLLLDGLLRHGRD